MGSFIEITFDLTFALNIVYLVTLLTLIPLAFYKVSYRFYDRSNIIILSTVFLTIFCQVVGLGLFVAHLGGNIMNSINLTCDMIKWTIIFLFIFEMLTVIITITSNSH